MALEISKDVEITRLQGEVSRLTRELAVCREELDVYRKMDLRGARANSAYPPEEALHAYLMKHAPVGIMLKDIDDDFRYVDLNTYATERLGVAREQGIGRTDFDWLPRDMAQRLRSHDLEAVEVLCSETPAERHISRDGFVCADGVWRDWLSLRCLLALPGRHRLLVVCATEVTDFVAQERKTQELYALAAAERDRAVRAEHAEAFIADALQEVMALPPEQNAMDLLLRRIGEHLQVDRCYVYTCRLHGGGWVTDDVYEWCAEGIPPEAANLRRKGPPGLPEFCDVIDAGGDYVFQSPENLPDETRMWFERRGVLGFFSTPITDEQGVSVGYLGLDFVIRPPKDFSPVEVHNIHEVASIVKLCLTRQKALEVLRNAERTKSDFFASISHDIRTPLNAIIGFTQLLRGETNEDVRSEYLKNIAFSGETLLALVNDVLDTFRLESGRMKFFRTMFDPSYLLRRVLATLAPSAEEKGVELKVDAADLPMLSLDEKCARQLLFNLIGNAIKFTDDGTVSVNASFTPVDDKVGCVHFSVQDTGIGISPRDLDKVGRPYVRLDMDSTARGGTGLGLAICRRIIEQSGGTLDISSELGKGTTVTVELPGVKYSRTAPEDVHGRKMIGGGEMTVAPPDRTYDFSNLKVLVVDDLEMNRCVLVASCRRLGVGRVLEAKSGIEALDILGSQIANPPDIILTDMKMPGMDGCELIRRVRMVSALAEVPICLVTADVEARRYALESGAFDILLKPVLQSNLVAILSKITPPPPVFEEMNSAPCDR